MLLCSKCDLRVCVCVPALWHSLSRKRSLFTLTTCFTQFLYHVSLPKIDPEILSSVLNQQKVPLLQHLCIQSLFKRQEAPEPVKKVVNLVIHNNEPPFIVKNSLHFQYGNLTPSITQKLSVLFNASRLTISLGQYGIPPVSLCALPPLINSFTKNCCTTLQLFGDATSSDQVEPLVTAIETIRYCHNT